MKKFFTLLSVMMLAIVANAQVCFDFDSDYATLFPSLPGVSSGTGATYVADGEFNADQVITIDGVTVSIKASAEDAATRNRVWASSPRLRMYNESFSISAPGHQITSIEFAAKSGNFNVTASEGTLDGMAWTGSSEAVTFAVNKNTQIKTITVTYGDSTPETVAVEGISLTDAAGAPMGMYQGMVKGETLQLKAVVAPANATNKNVTWEVMQEEDVISLENGLVKALAPGRAAVVATTEDGEFQAAVTIIVTEPQLSTIADFIANQGGTCYLRGVVSDIKSTLYGNFNLTDASGTIYVYGCLTPEGQGKQFESLGIQEGDEITVLASDYQLYKGETSEAVNVIFVENHGAPAAPAEYSFEVEAGVSDFTVTPSDENVQYYIEVLEAGYDEETITGYFDMIFEEMGEGLEYFSGNQKQSYVEDWYIEDDGDYVIALCAVSEDYKRASDVVIVPFSFNYLATGIQVAQAQKNAPIYNLAGQKVTSAHKGIVIRNGKKMLVK